MIVGKRSTITNGRDVIHANDIPVAPQVGTLICVLENDVISKTGFLTFCSTGHGGKPELGEHRFERQPD